MSSSTGRQPRRYHYDQFTSGNPGYQCRTPSSIQVETLQTGVLTERVSTLAVLVFIDLAFREPLVEYVQCLRLSWHRSVLAEKERTSRSLIHRNSYEEGEGDQRRDEDDEAEDHEAKSHVGVEVGIAVLRSEHGRTFPFDRCGH